MPMIPKPIIQAKQRIRCHSKTTGYVEQLLFVASANDSVESLWLFDNDGSDLSGFCCSCRNRDRRGM